MFYRSGMPHAFAAIGLVGMVLLGSIHGARAAELAVVAPIKSCAEIKALDLSRGAAGPARIDLAEITADGAQPFCIVKGYVAPAVNFVIRLPASGWTQRYLQLGCGGYCGGATLSQGSVDRQSAGCSAYASKEMAVATSDLGHRRSATFFPDGVWAAGNPGAIVNFAYAANHKTALVVKEIIRAFYGQEPKFSYFSGYSDGGRQGLEEAQRFPEGFRRDRGRLDDPGHRRHQHRLACLERAGQFASRPYADPHSGQSPRSPERCGTLAPVPTN